jgi:hypothetical protein
MTAETYQIEAEYTDTFGGEPNYNWVIRAILDVPQGASDRSIMRRMKAALHLSGVRGRSHSMGNRWEFRPYGCCAILMGRVVY